MAFNPFKSSGGGGADAKAKPAASGGGAGSDNPFAREAKTAASSSSGGAPAATAAATSSPSSSSSSGGGAPLVSGAPSRLASAPINLAALRDDAFGELTDILDKLPGRILLVVDPKLIAPLKLVVAEGSKALKEHRVEGLVELTSGPLNTECDSVIYLARPAFDVMKTIAGQVRGMVRRWDAGKEVRKTLQLALVPRRTFIAEQVLRDEHGESVVRLPV